MKVFVWENIDECTDAYHSRGGVVVFADTEERARELANAQKGCKMLPKEKPDDVRDVFGGDEGVFIMPNAGCC
ncbi:MAG TPA: hypothetical protein ACFYD4_16465 [Candidatus Wunengus sp. YC61]|uniref:hypothetical protein n=1 Tax=Candidatus Wunengus sp. YC61 TaxID=3367698 RepID=UPI0040267357